MLNVLIVDDEPLIRQGLKTIIDWQQLGLNICGEAENGKEGLRKILDICPHIAIVDIKMPDMDGLQLAEKLKKCGNACKVIFLTAYSDFKFAQKAVELGVESYLLKPIDQDELIEKVCTVRDGIKLKNEMQGHLNEGISVLKMKALESLVLQEVSNVLLDKYNRLYGFEFPWPAYQIIVIRPEPRTEGEQANGVRPEVIEVISSYIGRNNYGYAFKVSEEIVVLLKNVSSESGLRTFSYLQKIVQEDCKEDIVVSIGLKVGDVDLIPHSYRYARKLFEKRFIMGNKKIIGGMENTGDIHPGQVPPAGLEMEKVAEILSAAVDLNQMKVINDLLEEVRSQFVDRNETEQKIKMAYANLYILIMDQLAGSNARNIKFLHLKKTVLDEIHKKSSLQELHGYFKFVLLTESEEIAKFRPSSPIRKVTDYIDRNYFKDLKLEGIAHLFNYNSAYLGKLFKSQTGEYFNNYLNLVRVEKAKRFLKEKFKVYQVAEMTGYKDIDYFYRKFKQFTGVSPTEYKDKP